MAMQFFVFISGLDKEGYRNRNIYPTGPYVNIIFDFFFQFDPLFSIELQIISSYFAHFLKLKFETESRCLGVVIK